MKKAILGTILSIGGVVTVTTAGVFLPVYMSYQGYNSFEYNYQLAFPTIDLQTTDRRLTSQFLSGTNISAKSLILGDTSVNNGTYIFYLASDAYSNHRTFMYGNEYSNENLLQTNPFPKLNGMFGEGMKYLNSTKFNENKLTNINNPKVFTYIDRITESDWIAKTNYEKMVDEYKNLRITNDNIQEGEVILTEAEIEENKKLRNWAENAQPWSFEPGRQYTDWNNNSHYFRASADAGNKFLELYNFIKRNFKNVLDLNTSNGIVIAYVNGKITTNMFTGSFSSSSSDDSGDTTTQNMSFYNPYLAIFNPKSIVSTSNINDDFQNNIFVLYISSYFTAL